MPLAPASGCFCHGLAATLCSYARPCICTASASKMPLHLLQHQAASVMAVQLHYAAMLTPASEMPLAPASGCFSHGTNCMRTAL
eukprot:1159706-Pelagomonas_calceolata.AAC.10